MTEKRGSAHWAALGWVAGVLALLLALPLLTAGRLPDRVATHWDAVSGRPDGSMPLWAAAVFPALIWAVVAAVVAAAHMWRGPATAWGGTVLLSMGVTLAGAQAAIVRANMDHARWRDADSVTPWVVGALVAGAAAGAAGALTARRRTPGAARPTDPPRMDVPPDRRVVWLASTSNPWLHALAAVAGAVALVALVLTACGATDPLWPLIVPFALVAVASAACASVQVLVTENGLRVAFGPLGWPARRWRPADIESAHAERRTPAQVGGWGYRLSGLGTTVMLRAGGCLVIRAKGRNFAVSVDDAERGAALLNRLSQQAANTP
ncbi:DUF1648 domain-containing protein [Streptomyces aurantiacus]|uniref:DUF1648 domain-containing protein n=1 Tax=Streptomyces aurantiacus JA 4570 TaxID=1286094 RepID=S3ZID6_9ACTN|nr:DUF1648 domain-containing protein [Streptomyces aurantiacus]EPH42918.1 hypothetical protein STRAU_4002 [Streptomyces aurantiacus JA 4570]